jgi:hypothetical protein
MLKLLRDDGVPIDTLDPIRQREVLDYLVSLVRAEALGLDQSVAGWEARIPLIQRIVRREWDRLVPSHSPEFLAKILGIVDEEFRSIYGREPEKDWAADLTREVYTDVASRMPGNVVAFFQYRARKQDFNQLARSVAKSLLKYGGRKRGARKSKSGKKSVRRALSILRRR